VATLRAAAEAGEKDIARLNREIAALDAKLADPKLYNGGAFRAAELQKTRGECANRLAAAEERWLEASTALEAAGKDTEAA
jgi:ATP-binding cassette subfamily F protein 3